MLTLDTLEIAEHDALDEVINLWDFNIPAHLSTEGWRLPTRNELNLMYEIHQKSDGGFRSDRYMSSEYPEYYRNWALNFADGTWLDLDVTESHWGCCWIRLVREKANP